MANLIDLKIKHLLTGEELNGDSIRGLISLGMELKAERKSGKHGSILKGRNLAMLFDKQSLRTRFSFTAAMSELGGSSIESVQSTRKKEEPEDLARVLSGYSHGVMIRTHEDSFIERMASVSTVPIINGLSEFHHPCQILADLMTLTEVYKSLKGVTLAYVGDGNNILNSLLLMAPQVGVNIRYCCPKEYQPHSLILKKVKARALECGATVTFCKTPEEAVKGANAVYTDVWTSMGFEKEEKDRDEAFAGYEVNEALMELAAPNAVVMHCLPMVRGKEISSTLPDKPCSVIFQQSENRLHIQKAILAGLLV